MKRALAALAFAAVAFAGPASAMAAQSVEGGSLPHGGTYLMAPDGASATAAIGLWFRAPDDGYGVPIPGLARVAATAAAAAKLESGRTLAEIVAQAGGRLTIEVFPDIAGIDVDVPSAQARVVLASLTAAYFAPAIDASALHAAQSDATILAVQQQYETGALTHALLFTQIFANGPAHDPPIPLSAAAVSHVTLEEVTQFAHQAFRAGNAFLTLAGNVDPSLLSVVTDGSGPASPDAPAQSGVVGSMPEPLVQSGALPGIGIGWIGPPIADERAATALDFISDYLFHSHSGTLVQALTSDNDDIEVAGQFITLHDPGVFVATVIGSSDLTLEHQIEQGVAAMREPLSAAAFDAAREAFLYHLAEDTQTPQAEAGNLGWYATEGSASYAPGGQEYERIARSLDPQYVAAVVRRYLSQPAVVRITPESTSRAQS